MQASTISRVEEALDVGPELGAVLGAGGRRIGRVGVGDDLPVDHGIHARGVGLPHEDRIAVLPVVLAVGLPEGAAPRVGRRDAEQERVRHRAHGGPERVEDLDIRGSRCPRVRQKAISSQIAATT